MNDPTNPPTSSTGPGQAPPPSTSTLAFAPPSPRAAGGGGGGERPPWPAPATPRPPRQSTVVRLAWIIPGAILAIAALAWGTFNVLTLLSHEQRTERATFAAADVASVEITSDNGVVRLSADGTDEISVTASINDGWQQTDVDMRIVGGVLEIHGSCSFLGQPWCSSDFTVTLPADMPVRVDASNGSVHADGLSGAIDLDTDNGRIEVTDVSGAVRLSNDNGSIVGRRIGVASVDASTDNGRVELSFVEPPDDVRVRTSNGRIEVIVPDHEVAYRVQLSTDNGSQDIGVRTDPASLHTIDLSSRNGSVSVNPPG